MTDAYDPATRPCSGKATKGATVLQQSILGYWPAATNLGVYICRPTAGGSPSVHGNGRAGDDGCRGELGDAIANWLVANHTTLGVQLVIWNHRKWNVSIPGGWRPYGCDKPGSDLDHHTGHVHWEINVDAGTRLTKTIVDSVRPNQPPPIPQPDPEEPMLRIVQCRDHPEQGEFLTNGIDSVRTLTQAAKIHGINLGFYPAQVFDVPHDWLVWVDQAQDGHHNPGDV